MPLRPWPAWLVHLLLLALCAAQQSDRAFRPLDHWAKVPGSRSTAADYVQRLRDGPPLGEYGTQMCVIRLSKL